MCCNIIIYTSNRFILKNTTFVTYNEYYGQLFLFQQRTTKRHNPFFAYCYQHSCIQMDFITKRYERRFQYTRKKQRQGV